jgi:hypothetical protein
LEDIFLAVAAVTDGFVVITTDVDTDVAGDDSIGW